MHPNATIIQRFYDAFSRKDYASMQNLYRDEAQFSDPVFQQLTSREVKAMWQMLILAGKDLKITCGDVWADGSTGSCRWDAWYTFSKTGRKVHNIIHARFEFKDGMIVRHDDHFDFWRWSRQALGLPGIFLGWSGAIRGKVQRSAREGLAGFMSKADA